MAEPLPTHARSLLDAWTSYETLVLAFTFIAVFQHLTPASNYLQTQGLDINQAFNNIRNAKKKVEQLHDSIAEIVSEVNKFINTIYENDLFGETGIYIETEFPATRQRKVKEIPGEECINESSTISQQGPSKKFEIDTYKNRSQQFKVDPSLIIDELINFSHNFEDLKQSPSVSTADSLLKDSCDEDSYLEDSDADSEDENLDLDRQIVYQDGLFVRGAHFVEFPVGLHIHSPTLPTFDIIGMYGEDLFIRFNQTMKLLDLTYLQ
ncbi:hypothetical protein ILUMI_12404 [Ignelater luminosus]|uniref:Uncharacterized protein n=1 Tax=Ignelater luminosus TaxID=2038154 RepID=A0A8K0CUC7_IGNLU|nr:hypothetical protein ILUMI_12404 [Ignelater luminosus]